MPLVQSFLVLPVCVSDTFPGLADLNLFAQWCNDNVDFVVVGPEDPLANGVVDALFCKGVPCFGPLKAATSIEANKAYAKEFMREYGIPTAAGNCFTESTSAKHYVLRYGFLKRLL